MLRKGTLCLASLAKGAVSSGAGVRPLASTGIVQTRQSHLLTYERLSEEPLTKYFNLPGAKDNCYLTYVWIDGTGVDVRAKTKWVPKEPERPEDCSKWQYDGSSTYQAVGHDSDMLLHPVALCKDPFFPGKSKLVLCEVYDKKGTPASTNHRARAKEYCDKARSEDPWFGIEQEYTLLGTDNRPIGFPPHGFPESQGPYYCAVGAGRTVGREVCDAHMLASQYAGLQVTGSNAEVLLGQWEYQVGPCKGIDAADELWLSRYILNRVAEDFGVTVSLDPKPIKGDWNGTGKHCNFSTKAMREEGGIKKIWDAIKKLEGTHAEHIKAYDPHGGEDNKRRLTGRHETASFTDFSAAAGSRNVSVRIPRGVEQAGKGWLEDRRPSANADPYQVIAMLLKSCCL